MNTRPSQERMTGEELCRNLSDLVNASIGGTPRLTLPSVQQFHCEVLVMLHKRHQSFPAPPSQGDSK